MTQLTKRVAIGSVLIVGTSLLQGCAAERLTSPTGITAEPTLQRISPDHAGTQDVAALRRDIARLQKISNDPVRSQRFSISTMRGETMTAIALVEELQSHRSRLMFGSNGATTLYLGGPIVAGRSTISPNGAPPGSRWVEYWAFTTCSDCTSASTQVGGEMHMVQATSSGAPTLNAYNSFGTFGYYASGSYITAVSGDLQNASISTRHVARIVWRDYIFFSSASARV